MATRPVPRRFADTTALTLPARAGSARAQADLRRPDRIPPVTLPALSDDKPDIVRAGAMRITNLWHAVMNGPASACRRLRFYGVARSVFIPVYCHSRAAGMTCLNHWIPAFAGMTTVAKMIAETGTTERCYFNLPATGRRSLAMECGNNDDYLIRRSPPSCSA